MDSIIIRLAGEPQGKGRPRFVRATGRAFTPEKTRHYESDLRLAAQDVMGCRVPLRDQVAVLITASFPIPASMSKQDKAAALAGTLRPAKKPDCDNIGKMVDALNGIVFVDDKQIVEQSIRKWYGARPELIIEVRPCSGSLV